MRDIVRVENRLVSEVAAYFCFLPRFEGEFNFGSIEQHSGLPFL